MLTTIVFVQPRTKQADEVITSQLSSIRSLSGKNFSSIDVISIDEARPSGCVAHAVSSDLTVFLHVKGNVDLDTEISKANKKLSKTRENIQKQQKLVGSADFKEKVAKELQEVEETKLRDFEIEERTFAETIKQFEDLKLEA